MEAKTYIYIYIYRPQKRRRVAFWGMSGSPPGMYGRRGAGDSFSGDVYLWGAVGLGTFCATERRRMRTRMRTMMTIARSRRIS